MWAARLLTLVNLEGRTAVVTGSSQGLGLCIARRLAEAGAGVVMLARTESDIRSAADTVRTTARFPDRVVSFRADVADAERIRQVVTAAMADHGKIDILVNNAGVHGPIASLESTDETEWRRAFEVNFFGALTLLRLLLPHFKTNNYGRIINLSGGGATKGMHGFSCYSASKAALVRLTETIALETKDFDITINAVAPGALNTRLLDDALGAGSANTGKSQYEALLKQRATGGSSPEKAADLCCFLASDECRGITGRLISAVWDDWPTLVERREAVAASDVYLLRRISAKDRGFDWDGET